MVWVYAISSLDQNYIYVGMTIDLKSRLNRHNSGREKTTKHHAPFRLIYKENCLIGLLLGKEKNTGSLELVKNIFVDFVTN